MQYPSKFSVSLLEGHEDLRSIKSDLALAIARHMNVSNWEFFATRFGLEEQVIESERFLRSLKWGDDDYEGHVLTLVSDLLDENPTSIEYLLNEYSRIVKDLPEETQYLLDLNKQPQEMALVNAVKQLEESHCGVDFSKYVERIYSSLPNQPDLAIGTTKELLEAVMKEILFDFNESGLDNFDFPTLTKTCFAKLGLQPDNEPETEAVRAVRKVFSNSKKMILAINELRNRAGSGHGRIADVKSEIGADEARLVAAQGIASAAWLLKKAHPKSGLQSNEIPFW